MHTRKHTKSTQQSFNFSNRPNKGRQNNIENQFAKLNCKWIDENENEKQWKAMKSQRGSFLSQFHCVHLFWFLFSSFSRHLSFICRILCEHHYLISCSAIIPVSTHLQFISEENRKGKQIVLHAIYIVYVCGFVVQMNTGSIKKKKKEKGGKVT